MKRVHEYSIEKDDVVRYLIESVLTRFDSGPYLRADEKRIDTLGMMLGAIKMAEALGREDISSRLANLAFVMSCRDANELRKCGELKEAAHG